MINFCFHKFGKVENGYQYCQKCGIAKAAPKVSCNHKWKEKYSTKIISSYTNHVIKRTILYECIHCGETRKEVISA